MVVGGLEPYFVYVYQAYSPYDMVAKIHIDSYKLGFVTSLVISDDNTIAVTHFHISHSYNYYLTNTMDPPRGMSSKSSGWRIDVIHLLCMETL